MRRDTGVYWFSPLAGCLLRRARQRRAARRAAPACGCGWERTARDAMPLRRVDLDFLGMTDGLALLCPACGRRLFAHTIFAASLPSRGGTAKSCGDVSARRE